VTPRTDVIAAAALAFAQALPKRPTAPSIVDAVLPETAKALAEVVPFEQKTPTPRGLAKTFVSSAIVRVLTKQKTLDQVLPILVASERDYVLSVLDEVYQWAEKQGFNVPAPHEVRT
jgi:pantothenate kinase-related protein Tda10